MTVKQTNQVGGDLGQEAWTLYRNAFTEINALAVQRHLMYRDEFAGVMLDGRVQKYLHLDDAGAIDGLAAYTNHLDAVPLISWQYFQRRWPEHYAAGRIWYVEFVAVAEHAPITAFWDLIEAMHLTSGTAAITALDVCAQRHELPRSVEVLLRRISGAVTVERLDVQSYWLYEFPDTQD